MSDYRPTFRRSAERRPLLRRLTPAAWALLGVLVVVCVGCTAVGVLQVAPTLTEGGDEPWYPTDTPTARPTETAVPTVPTVPTEGPSPAPTGSPTPEPTESGDPFPAWWADQMTWDEETRQWMAPLEVVEMVKEHAEEIDSGYNAYLVDTKPPDLDGYEQMLPTWYSGEQLQVEVGFLAATREGANTLTTCSWEMCLPQVQEFSEDGLECTYGTACSGGVCRELDPNTGDVLSNEDVPHSGLTLMRMRYDFTDGRWKIDRFIAYYPPPER